MRTVWHVKCKITFKLVINSRRICRGPAVEKHWLIISHRPPSPPLSYLYVCVCV